MVDEVCQVVFELKNVLRFFGQLVGVKDKQVYGFDEKKLDMYGEYCKYFFDVVKVYFEVVECEEQQL